MKKNQKKGKLLLGLLVGVVLLGIGYAAITNVTLSINGSAKAVGSATDADFVVRFVQSTDSGSQIAAVQAAAANPASHATESTNTDLVLSQSVEDDTHAKFNVDKMVTGDEVTFTYYIANLSNGLGAKITPTVTNEYSGNFEVTINPNAAFDLAENGVQAVTVTVKCIAQNKLDTAGSFTVSFDAAAVE